MPSSSSPSSQEDIGESVDNRSPSIVSEIVKVKPKKLKKGPKLTNKINPSFEFPDAPEDFNEKYASISWASSEHDELGKKLFKSKESVTHNEEFGEYFPRYSVVKQNRRASKPYARRKINAFIHKTSSVAAAISADISGCNENLPVEE